MINYLQKLNGNNSNTLSEKEQIELQLPKSEMPYHFALHSDFRFRKVNHPDIICVLTSTSIYFFGYKIKSSSKNKHETTTKEQNGREKSDNQDLTILDQIQITQIISIIHKDKE